MAGIKAGDRVRVLTAFGDWVERRATTGVVMGADFLVVRVCREEEWLAGETPDERPSGSPWPAEDVQPIEERTSVGTEA